MPSEPSFWTQPRRRRPDVNPTPYFFRFFLFTQVLLICLCLQGDAPPDVDTLLTSYQAEVERIEQNLSRDLDTLREQAVRRLNALEASAVRDHSDLLRLWTHRHRSRITELGEHWPDILADPLDPPGPIQEWNTRALGAVVHARERAGAALKLARTDTLTELDLLIRTLTRADRIDDAIAVQTIKNAFPQKHAPHPLDQRIDRLESIHEKTPGPFRPAGLEQSKAPADASFPFFGDNPAFEAFLKQIRVVSAGHRDGPEAHIALARPMERAIRFSGTRGLSLVALKDGNIFMRETYDTYADAEESARFVEDIRNLPYDTLVILAVRDDATRRFTGSAQAALFRLGAETGILGLAYRSSYLLIGAKGLAPGQAVEHSDPGRIEFPGVRPAN